MKWYVLKAWLFGKPVQEPITAPSEELKPADKLQMIKDRYQMLRGTDHGNILRLEYNLVVYDVQTILLCNRNAAVQTIIKWDIEVHAPSKNKAVCVRCTHYKKTWGENPECRIPDPPEFDYIEGKYKVRERYYEMSGNNKGQCTEYIAKR